LILGLLILLIHSTSKRENFEKIIVFRGVPIFALPWMLTWFSHSLKNMGTILRIFDYLICSPPYSIIYMCAAVLLMTREQLLGSTEEELDVILKI